MTYHGRDFSRDYIKNNSIDVGNKDVYCFGIFTGRSCDEVGRNFKVTEKKPSTFWGFDSFEDLPNEREGMFNGSLQAVYLINY